MASEPKPHRRPGCRRRPVGRRAGPCVSRGRAGAHPRSTSVPSRRFPDPGRCSPARVDRGPRKRARGGRLRQKSNGGSRADRPRRNAGGAVGVLRSPAFRPPRCVRRPPGPKPLATAAATVEPSGDAPAPGCPSPRRNGTRCHVRAVTPATLPRATSHRGHGPKPASMVGPLLAPASGGPSLPRPARRAEAPRSCRGLEPLTSLAARRARARVRQAEAHQVHHALPPPARPRRPLPAGTGPKPCSVQRAAAVLSGGGSELTPPVLPAGAVRWNALV